MIRKQDNRAKTGANAVMAVYDKLREELAVERMLRERAERMVVELLGMLDEIPDWSTSTEGWGLGSDNRLWADAMYRRRPKP